MAVATVISISMKTRTRVAGVSASVCELGAFRTWTRGTVIAWLPS
jgi:hypothetical protein